MCGSFHWGLKKHAGNGKSTHNQDAKDFSPGDQKKMPHIYMFKVVLNEMLARGDLEMLVPVLVLTIANYITLGK